MRNYDLNIWDKVGYETEYAREAWSISVYTIPADDAHYGSGDFLTSLDLTPEEARALTLGVPTTKGGDYSSDPDFWLDLESFFVIYSEIPSRVQAFLTSLYEEKEGKDELLSVWQELGARNS